MSLWIKRNNKMLRWKKSEIFMTFFTREKAKRFAGWKVSKRGHKNEKGKKWMFNISGNNFLRNVGAKAELLP